MHAIRSHVRKLALSLLFAGVAASPAWAGSSTPDACEDPADASRVLATAGEDADAKQIAERCKDAAVVPAQAGLVDVATLAPGIDLDIRYYGSENFVGRRVHGYEAPKCYLLPAAAEALAQVEHDLRAQGYALRIYDCYRPQRAVSDFVAWSRDLADIRTKTAHYPNLDKRDLLGDYIAPVSGHSKGATVDLTMMRCGDAGCTALDMGTDFDLFDPLANTDSPKATPLQHANRQHLAQAMAKRGFVNYPMEWWHFTLRLEPAPERVFDVPVR